MLITLAMSEKLLVGSFRISFSRIKISGREEVLVEPVIKSLGLITMGTLQLGFAMSFAQGAQAFQFHNDGMARIGMAE